MTLISKEIVVFKVSHRISNDYKIDRLFSAQDFQYIAIVNISLNKNSNVRTKLIQNKKREIQAKHVLKITEEN